MIPGLNNVNKTDEVYILIIMYEWYVLICTRKINKIRVYNKIYPHLYYQKVVLTCFAISRNKK